MARITGHRRKSAKRAAIGVRKRSSKKEKGLRRLLLLMILGGIGGALLLAGLAVAALSYGVPQASDATDAGAAALGHVSLDDLQGRPQDEDVRLEDEAAAVLPRPPPRSLLQLIGTGIVLGTVHVLSGPDHLSALLTLSVGGGWRAFVLGARWGCGHSIGLIVMTTIFFIFDIDLEAIGPACEALVGVFMIALGIGSGYRALLSPGAGATETELQSLTGDRDGVNSAEQTTDVETDGYDISSPSKPSSHAHLHGRSIHNPHLQKCAAVGIGIVHGVAGPGGVLGVLPAVELHSVKLASVYLGSFCVTSIFIMAAFAAAYGEVTARLGYGRDRLLHCMTLGSAMLSLVVGVLWLVLLWFGVLDDVFP
jgi:hypothetical protein